MLYFAYGSNLDPQQMQRRCPNYVLVGPAVLPDCRIAFTAYSDTWCGGLADVVPALGREVWGVLYELTDEDLALLDRHEGHPAVYARQARRVFYKGRREQAWVYEVVKKEGPFRPSADYQAILLQAAGDYGFPERYTEELKQSAKGQAG